MKAIFTKVFASFNRQEWIVIRSHHNRKINASSSASLKTHIQSQCCIDEYMPEVSGNNRHRRKRMAQMELRYEKIRLCRPSNAVLAKKYLSEEEVYTVHVKDKADSVPHGEGRQNGHCTPRIR